MKWSRAFLTCLEERVATTDVEWSGPCQRTAPRRTSPLGGPVDRTGKRRRRRCGGSFARSSFQDASSEALAKLAQDTGGVALGRTNNFSKGMRLISEDVNGYYELTYTPAPGESDDESRQVEVRVARDGAKV
jgi:hypothetical protein